MCAGILLSLAVLPVPLSSLSAQTETKVVEYRLKRGEGLSDVARKHGVSYEEILRLNRTRLPYPNDPNTVFTGMAIRVPVKVPVEAKPAPKPAPKPATKPATGAAGTQGSGAVSQPDNAQKAPEAPAVTAQAPKPDAAPAPAPNAEAPAGEDKGNDGIFPSDKTLENISDQARQAAGSGDESAEAAGVTTGWYVVAALVLIACIGALAAVYFAWRALRFLSETSRSHGGELQLVGLRELGKNSQVYWLKAGNKDLFVSTGDAHILSPLPSVEASDEDDDESGAPVAAASSSRRPRKNSRPSTETAGE